MSGLICSICINDLISDEHPLCSTMCGHLFHVDCWTKWTINGSPNVKCPKCQKLNGHVLKLYPDKEADEEEDDEELPSFLDYIATLMAQIRSALEEIERYKKSLKQSEDNFLLLSGQYSQLEQKAKQDKENQAPARKVRKTQERNK